MRIVPVIDVLNGVVVRAVGGRREEYRPIRSSLIDSTDPLTVAQAMADAVKSRTIYVADLDAITSERNNLEQIHALSKAGFEVWADIGVVASEQLHLFKAGGRIVPVIASETVRHLRTFDDAVNEFGERGVIASVDLRGGELLGRWDYWGYQKPLAGFAYAGNLYRRGVRRFLVLDLEAVGERQGVTTVDLCRAMKEELEDIELIAGGGIRDPNDVDRLATVGVDAVLLSTAIHDGRFVATGLWPVE